MQSTIAFSKQRKFVDEKEAQSIKHFRHYCIAVYVKSSYLAFRSQSKAKQFLPHADLYVGMSGAMSGGREKQCWNAAAKYTGAV